MFKFIKNLLGIGAQESVKDIVTPQAPYKIEPPNEVVITRVLAPASNPDVIVAPVVTKPVRKSKPKVTEGKTKGGGGAVKKPKANTPKPKAPAKPKSKK